MEVTPLSFGVRGWTFGPSLDTMIPVFYWKDHFFIYNHRLLFVIGLVFSRSLTRNAFVSILTWYFASNGDDVVKSAILSNAFDLISSIFVIFMAYLADSFIGRFQTLLFSNIAYIGALVLFYMFHPYDVTWLLVISLVLLALGTSGDQILEDVLQDLVNDIDKSPDREETRSIARATIWSRVTNMSAAVLSTLLWAIPHATSGLDSSWKSAFVICIIPMILAVIVSGFGHNVYHQGELTEIQLDILGCLKIFSRHKRSPKNMDIEKGETEGIKQEITLHLEDKVVLKSLLEMLPMWLAFSVVSIISAAGNTFFLQQYSNLDTDNDIAVQLYTLVQEFSSFAIAFLYRWICCLPKNEKVKIGVGMLCGLASCICAWQLEVYRLKEVSYLVDEEHTYTSISFLWLVPQFCLVGCMKGLTEEGLLEFYNSQMKKEHYLQRYREEYIAFVMGIGKVLNIFLILICRGWFGDTINESRLDKYYSVMVCVGSANFITYCCIARFFYKGQELVDADDDVDFANDDVQQDHFIEQSSDIEQQKDLANDDQNHDNQDFANDDLQRYYSREQSRDIEQNRDTGLASSVYCYFFQVCTIFFVAISNVFDRLFVISKTYLRYFS